MKKALRAALILLLASVMLMGTIPAAAAAETRTEQSSASKKNYPSKYNGVDLSAIYDYEWYVANNAYAKKHFKGKPKAAILYFGRYAIRKNVRAKAEYSKKVYKSLRKKTHPYPTADKILDKLDWNLKKAFLYSADIKKWHGKDLGERNKPWKKTTRWYYTYGLRKKKGNCYVKAATFCVLAREMGYEVRQYGGNIPYRSGGSGPHSWMEIKYKGKWKVCDPSFFYNFGRKKGYMFKYGTKGTYRYTDFHKLKL